MTDTERLDWLTEQGKKWGVSWIARNSNTGRGYRLHQNPTTRVGENHGLTPRDAIDAAMKREDEPLTKGNIVDAIAGNFVGQKREGSDE